MAFDQSTRNRLQRLVSDARMLLTQEFTRQVQHEYGMDPATGEVADVDKLSHMDDTRWETARLLRDTLNHYLATSQSGGNKETLERIVREQAFTVLNRLAALRMMEARGLLIESVARGYQSKGFQLYQRLAGSALGETGDAYRCYVFSLFDEFALDLPVLFDRFSPQGRLFPRESALLALFGLINHPEIESLWAEDETIGWIYQYYNSQEERRQMRADSQAPRNSRELAVRNQFFTPRYVVEFLTDNTLGRLWYEMTQGQTGLTEQCRYLVRRPNEIFLQSGEEAPTQAEAQEERSQGELLQQPVYIPFRVLKDPRDITMLDPACGSMHFGLYAFDLFEVIYDEAWEIAHGGDEARKSSTSFAPFVAFVVPYPDKAAFLADVPRLIIEHNLHGIDIDPRAAQIAGLSLWLRAQRTWQQQGLRPQDRPRIRRSNIVCAEPMPGEEAFLEEFIEAHLSATPEHKVLSQLVRREFDAMKLAGEAGSLLKIEEEIASVVAEAKQKWLAGPKIEQGRLFADDTAPPAQQELSLDVTGITDETFWEKAEERIYAALQTYAEQAEHGSGYQRRLFADDTARGFAFIDLCRKRYDVILMNPPFGEASLGSREYLYKSLPVAARDLFAGFVSRFNDLLIDKGRLGILSNRTAFFSDFLASWRVANFSGRKARLNLVGDLGYGVLDAVVEAAAYVCAKDQREDCQFINVLNVTDKGDALATQVHSICTGQATKESVTRTLESFEKLPDNRFAYQLHPVWTRKLNLEGDHNLFVCKAGLTSGDDTRNLRLGWEIEPAQIAKRWKWLAKGGEFSRYRSDLHLLVDWQNRDYLHRIRNSELYGNRGVTYTERTTSNLSARVLNEGSCFSGPGPGLIPKSEEHLHFLLAYMNSFAVSYCIESIVGGGDFSMKGTAARHLEPGYMKNLPMVEILSGEALWFRQNVTQLLRLLESFVCDETDACFVGIPVDRSASLGQGLRSHTQDRFGLLLHGYQIIDSMEQRISDLLCLPEERVLDGYSDTGWPWPKNETLPDLTHSTILNSDPLSPHLIPAELDSIGSKYRFEMKLSHYLHAGVERHASCLGVAPASICRLLADQSTPSKAALLEYASSVLSQTFGTAFGRWDIQFATGEKPAPELPDPFAPLPVCPPGQLQNEQGLPITREDLTRLKEEGHWNYPLEIPWDGILVDDPGYPLDFETRVHQVLQVIWKDRWEAIEREACEILGVRTLRDYFRKPTDFFADHLKRYSKSRRKAPIYWPLQTPSCSYTLWLYYHRLNDQTLYTCVNDFVEKSKLHEVTEQLNTLRKKTDRSKEEEKKLDHLLDFEQELKDFRDELLRVAKFWKPNLNDGVQITAAPLWKLFQHKPWQKTLKETWEKLEKGDYDWAHLAYSIWPGRVRDACKHDKSLAIAHGLEDLYEAPPEQPKKKRGRTRE